MEQVSFGTVYFYAILNIIRYILCYKILFRLELKKNFVGFIWILIILGGSITALATVLNAPYDSVGSLVFLFEGLLIPIFLCERKNLNYIFLYPAAFAMDEMLGCIYNYLAAIILHTEANTIAQKVSCVKGLICVVVLWIICVLNNRYHPQRYENENRKLEILIYFAMMIISLVIVDGVSYISSGNNHTNPVMNNLIGLGVAVACVVMFFLCIWYARKESERLYQKAELTRYENYIEQQQNYIDDILKSNENIRRIRHDFKNHILSIRALAIDSHSVQTEEYCNRLLQDFQTVKNTVYTNNTVIDTILNHYFSEAEIKGIELTKKISVDLSQCEYEYEYCTLLSNLLTNAIEASAKTNTRWIELNMYLFNDKTVIVIENSADSAPIIKDGQIFTSKRDSKNHGLGTKNIKDTIDSLNGKIEYDFDNARFQAIAIL